MNGRQDPQVRRPGPGHSRDGHCIIARPAAGAHHAGRSHWSPPRRPPVRARPTRLVPSLSYSCSYSLRGRVPPFPRMRRRVRGTVVDPQGHPVSAVRVDVVGPLGARHVYTDASGISRSPICQLVPIVCWRTRGLLCGRAIRHRRRGRRTNAHHPAHRGSRIGVGRRFSRAGRSGGVGCPASVHVVTAETCGAAD